MRAPGPAGDGESLQVPPSGSSHGDTPAANSAASGIPASSTAVASAAAGIAAASSTAFSTTHFWLFPLFAFARCIVAPIAVALDLAILRQWYQLSDTQPFYTRWVAASAATLIVGTLYRSSQSYKPTVLRPCFQLWGLGEITRTAAWKRAVVAFFHCEFILQFALEMGHWRDAYRAVMTQQQEEDGSSVLPGGGSGGSTTNVASCNPSLAAGLKAAPAGAAHAPAPAAEEGSADKPPQQEESRPGDATPLSADEVSVSIPAVAEKAPEPGVTVPGKMPRGVSLRAHSSFVAGAEGAAKKAEALNRNIREKAAKAVAASVKAQQARAPRRLFLFDHATATGRNICSLLWPEQL